MVNERQRLRTMGMGNRKSTNNPFHFGRWAVRWRWSHVRSPNPSQEIDAPVSHTTTTKSRLFVTIKHANRPKSRLTMTVNTGRLRRSINNLRVKSFTRDHARREYVSVITVAALQEEIF